MEPPDGLGAPAAYPQPDLVLWESGGQPIQDGLEEKRSKVISLQMETQLGTREADGNRRPFGVAGRVLGNHDKPWKKTPPTTKAILQSRLQEVFTGRSEKLRCGIVTFFFMSLRFLVNSKNMVRKCRMGSVHQYATQLHGQV